MRAACDAQTKAAAGVKAMSEEKSRSEATAAEAKEQADKLEVEILSGNERLRLLEQFSKDALKIVLRRVAQLRL